MENVDVRRWADRSVAWRVMRPRAISLLLTMLIFPSVAMTVGAEGDGDRKETGASIAGTIAYSADPQRPWRYDRYYVDKQNGGRLAETLVCLRDRKLKNLAPRRNRATVVMDQKDFRFVPETLALQTGDRVKFTNSDSGSHNVFSSDDLHRFDVTLGYSDEAVETFSKAGGSRHPVVIGCKFHGSMRAWIYVFDHPWYQVTGTDGQFDLKNVPPGKYWLDVIHSSGRLRWTKRIEIKKDQSLNFDTRLSPDDLLKPSR